MSSFSFHSFQSLKVHPLNHRLANSQSYCEGYKDGLYGVKRTDAHLISFRKMYRRGYCDGVQERAKSLGEYEAILDAQETQEIIDGQG